MPTKDGFDPHHPLPLADEPEQLGFGKAWDRAVISSRILKASILVATATAIGIAVLSVGNPMTLFADVTASLVDKSRFSLAPISRRQQFNLLPILRLCRRPQRTRRPATKLLSPLNPPVRVRRKIVSHRLKPCSGISKLGRLRKMRSPGRNRRARSRAPARVVQSAPPQIAENARAPLRLMQKHRHVRPVHSARAEIRPVQNPRKKVRREQNARAHAPPAQDARAQDQSVQNAQAPSFLQTFGWRN